MKGVRRVGLGVIDQGLSSISNAVFLVAVARVASVEEFGAVSLAYALFVFGLAVQRGSLGTLTSLAATVRRPPPLVASFLGALLVVIVGVVLGVAVGVDDHPAYYVVLVASLVIYPQDLLRYDAIAQQRAGLAVISDGIWFAVTLALLCASILGASISVFAMACAWVVLGAVPSLVALVLPLRASLALHTRWVVDHASDLRLLGPDAVLSAVAPLILASVVAHYLSLDDVAAVRGAGTLLGPLSTLFSALQVVLLPEMARLLGDNRLRLAAGQALVMSLVVAMWGGFLFLIPDGAGRELLGDTWSASRAVLIWATLELMMWALATGPVALLTSYRRWKELLSLRVAYLVAVACALGVTVSSGDVATVMIGMLAASVVNCVLFYVVAAREQRRLRAATSQCSGVSRGATRAGRRPR